MHKYYIPYARVAILTLDQQVWLHQTRAAVRVNIVGRDSIVGESNSYACMRGGGKGNPSSPGKCIHEDYMATY